MSDLKQTIIRPFFILCVNNKDKPLNIDDEEWLNKEGIYIVTNIFSDLISGEESFVLLNNKPEPYKGFNVNRFATGKSIVDLNLISVN